MNCRGPLYPVVVFLFYFAGRSLGRSSRHWKQAEFWSSFLALYCCGRGKLRLLLWSVLLVQVPAYLRRAKRDPCDRPMSSCRGYNVSGGIPNYLVSRNNRLLPRNNIYDFVEKTAVSPYSIFQNAVSYFIIRPTMLEFARRIQFSTEPATALGRASGSSKGMDQRS